MRCCVHHAAASLSISSILRSCSCKPRSTAKCLMIHLTSHLSLLVYHSLIIIISSSLSRIITRARIFSSLLLRRAAGTTTRLYGLPHRRRRSRNQSSLHTSYTIHIIHTCQLLSRRVYVTLHSQTNTTSTPLFIVHVHSRREMKDTHLRENPLHSLRRLRANTKPVAHSFNIKTHVLIPVFPCIYTPTTRVQSSHDHQPLVVVITSLSLSVCPSHEESTH